MGTSHHSLEALAIPSRRCYTLEMQGNMNALLSDLLFMSFRSYRIGSYAASIHATGLQKATKDHQSLIFKSIWFLGKIEAPNNQFGSYI